MAIDAALRIVRPIAIASDAQLVSTNVPETDHAAWAAGTAYVVGDRVIRTGVHRVYQRLISGTSATAPENDPANWVQVSPTNRWKCFDSVNSTATDKAAGISFRVTPGALVNAVALLGLFAATARVRVVDPVDGTVYDRTINTAGGIREPDWWEYFAGRVVASRQVVLFDLPTYGTADVLVDLTPLGGSCTLGTFVCGAQQVIGQGVRYGARLGVTDYSVKSTNQFGDTVLTRRAYARRAEFEMWLRAAETDDAIYQLISLRAEPALYIGPQQYESAAVYGFFKDFSVTLSLPDANICSLQIEGLT